MNRIGRCAAAVVLAATLVGCEEGDPEPKISPGSSVSPSPTASSAAPEEESPEAFIRRWAQLETEMQNTGDTSAYRAVTAACQPCTRTADLVDEFYSAGGFIRTDGRTVESLRRLGVAKDAVSYQVRMRSAPTEYKERADGELRTFPGGVSDYRVELVRKRSEWHVRDYAELAS